MSEGSETEEPLIVMEFDAEESGLGGKSEHKISQVFFGLCLQFSSWEL